ncbi:DUF397 domain-containing protein [Saccharopolyspora rhizosphaerae]|uniref:DUF397 domain-containing protein n=1 Tax=Saccharopolyspora rhizosphaerae TaxID=2492662 RepID=A0A3R8VGI3_9PSEU|nr:DUF397 domain-containing protein [Saccharopolyspora rhizosphaerae]RRO17037.1 DUF397 domain-containing protein [Saccharopolyspora rhizosphaerae]
MNARPEWRKSSRSNQGGNCVEVALNLETPMIRDSKLGDASPVLSVEREAYRAFLRAVDSGKFTR